MDLNSLLQVRSGMALVGEKWLREGTMLSEDAYISNWKDGKKSVAFRIPGHLLRWIAALPVFQFLQEYPLCIRSLLGPAPQVGSRSEPPVTLPASQRILESPVLLAVLEPFAWLVGLRMGRELLKEAHPLQLSACLVGILYAQL